MTPDIIDIIDAIAAAGWLNDVDLCEHDDNVAIMQDDKGQPVAWVLDTARDRGRN